MGRQIDARMTDAELNHHKRTHTRANSWWLKDAMGIECSRVCHDCEDTVRSHYCPEVFDADRYRDVVEEPLGDEVDPAWAESPTEDEDYG